MSDVVGYILVEKKKIDLYGEEYYDADWNSEIYSTLEEAWEECKEANGFDWAENIDKYGLSKTYISDADFLPYALTLALPENRND